MEGLVPELGSFSNGILVELPVGLQMNDQLRNALGRMDQNLQLQIVLAIDFLH